MEEQTENSTAAKKIPKKYSKQRKSEKGEYHNKTLINRKFWIGRQMSRVKSINIIIITKILAQYKTKRLK